MNLMAVMIQSRSEPDRGMGGKPKIIAKLDPLVSNSAWQEFSMNVDVASAVIRLIKSAPDTGLRVTPMIPPRNSLAVGEVATCTVVSPQ